MTAFSASTIIRAATAFCTDKYSMPIERKSHVRCYIPDQQYVLSVHTVCSSKKKTEHNGSQPWHQII